MAQTTTPPKRTRGRARPAGDHSGYRLSDDAVERALLTGEHARLLEDYFGEARLESLRSLAREAAAKRARGGPRVLILPGIMGSKLGHPGPLVFDDVIWFDPVDIVGGKLIELALSPAGRSCQALGVILLAYLKLKLFLLARGYDAHFHAFDWRRDLAALGLELKRRIAADRAEVSLVAHSMGGLVARSAIAQGAEVRRLIMLGTPNYGSFAPVQALRATYSVVKGVAALDVSHTAEQLAQQVFGTFPGLYQMLPSREKFDAIDLFDAASWPRTGPRPRPRLLAGVTAAQRRLAPADERFLLVAGVAQETTAGLRVEGGEFVYDASLDGDGTVPLAFAQMEGARTWYVEESHGSLPNNSAVESAVADLLDKGTTDVLPDRWAPSRRGGVRTVREGELRKAAPFEGRRGRDLTGADVRGMLADVAAADARETARPARASVAAGRTVRPGAVPPAAGVVIDRSFRHRIDLRLALGSITEADAAAYVLGVFRDVAPSGPAHALDERLDSAIAEFTAHRMFSANVGEVFVLPTGRHPLRADVVLFAGLGPFDRLTDGVVRVAAENAIRVFIRTAVDDFATVLFGAGSGRAAAQSLENLLTGFLRGLRDLDRDRRMRRITFCETDPDRYAELRAALLRLSTTELFDDIDATIDEVTLPAPAAPARRPALVAAPEPAYLMVRQDGDLSVSLLTAGGKAAVISEVRAVPEGEFEQLLATLETPAFSVRTMERFGDRLAGLLLPESVVAALKSVRDSPLVVVHDTAASRVPWEAMRIAGRFPAAGAGMSRRYLADNLSVAKWLEQRRYGSVLDLLLVVNPTENLDGAEAEGARVRRLFERHSGVKVHELRGADATRAALYSAFHSGAYDVVHYAGHAFFDPARPESSGVVCYRNEVLSGADLAQLGNLPALVFFNACESARIRRGAALRDPKLHIKRRLERSLGLAEAFLRGGVANYLGTYWPVGDEAAKVFASTFYGELLAGRSIGVALAVARAAVRKLPSVDWADYIHYGSQDFVLKQR